MRVPTSTPRCPTAPGCTRSCRPWWLIPTLSLRVLARRRFEVADLVTAGVMDTDVAELLITVIAARLAFVIAGGTGHWKNHGAGRAAVVLRAR